MNEKPLVTFALFAYNQEQYIREAVEGAFAQTYEPLEIILSDDCSTDRTFEIMKEMAAEYEGPHEVRVRQNEVNRGTIDHVIIVAREAQGELFIVAAGDDVSKPERTEKVYNVFNKDTFAIISNHDTIDNHGAILKQDNEYVPLDRFQKVMQNCKIAKSYKGKLRNIPGHSAAYNRSFIAAVPLAKDRLFNEDSLFSYLINFEGKEIAHIHRSLVFVRKAQTSVSARKLENPTIDEVILREKKIYAGSKSKYRFYTYFKRICSDRNYACYKSAWMVLEKDMNEKEFVIKYYSSNPLERIKLIATTSSYNNLRFALIRSFGVPGIWLLAKVRYLFRRISQK